MTATQYRGYNIRHNPPPANLPQANWQFEADDYDGPGDGRIGFGPTLDDCKQQIDEMEDDES